MSAPPEPLGGVLETSLYYPPEVREETLELYEGVLGLRRVAAWGDGTALRCGSGVLLLFDLSLLAERTEPIADHGAEGAGHVCLVAPPGGFEAWRERLVGAGVEVKHEEEWPNGGRSLYFNDPAGNLLEIADRDIWPP
jgi:catechol 2,3-dioxygenase-like lactoylglutathione lyase family enzyme